MTFLDPWFIDQILQIVELEKQLVEVSTIDADLMRRAKRWFPDEQIGAPGMNGMEVRALRNRSALRPSIVW